MLTGFESNFLESFDGWDDNGDQSWQVYNAKILPNIFPEHIDVNKLYWVAFELNEGVIELYSEEDESETPLYSGKFLVKLV